MSTSPVALTPDQFAAELARIGQADPRVGALNRDDVREAVRREVQDAAHPAGASAAGDMAVYGVSAALSGVSALAALASGSPGLAIVLGGAAWWLARQAGAAHDLAFTDNPNANLTALNRAIDAKLTEAGAQLTRFADDRALLGAIERGSVKLDGAAMRAALAARLDHPGAQQALAAARAQSSGGAPGP